MKRRVCGLTDGIRADPHRYRRAGTGATLHDEAVFVVRSNGLEAMIETHPRVRTFMPSMTSLERRAPQSGDLKCDRPLDL